MTALEIYGLWIPPRPRPRPKPRPAEPTIESVLGYKPALDREFLPSELRRLEAAGMEIEE